MLSAGVKRNTFSFFLGLSPQSFSSSGRLASGPLTNFFKKGYSAARARFLDRSEGFPHPVWGVSPMLHFYTEDFTMSRLSIQEIDDVLDFIKVNNQKINDISLLDQITKDRTKEIRIYLDHSLPKFIDPKYDLRLNINTSLLVKIKKQDYPNLIKHLDGIKGKLEVAYDHIKTAIDMRDELDRPYYFITPHRKGEISNFITKIVRMLDHDDKFFASFGSGSNPKLINKPIITYLDRIIYELKPDYLKLLDDWEITYNKIEYLKLTEDLSEFDDILH